VCRRDIALIPICFLLATIVFLPEARGQSERAPISDFRPIGKVAAATGSVTIEHVEAVIIQANLSDTGVNQARVGDLVYTGDVIQTGTDAKAQITFADGTAFTVLSNARMVVDRFVYDAKSKSNSSLFSLTKGAFTFIAGKVAKTGGMEVDTPVATMGIRGTTPYVEFRADGSVAFSTLIEKDKNRAIEKREMQQNRRASLTREAQRNNASISFKQVDDSLGKKPNLKVCRGC
jgi:hypothetical protein